MSVEAKTEIRKKFTGKFPPPETHLEIKQKILNWEIYRKSTNIALYMNLKDEIDLSFIFDSGKKCYLPYYNEESKTYSMVRIKDKNSLVKGKFDILEPSKNSEKAEKNEIELWLIPGVAFDLNGTRLGRGKGFYDRLLADENGIKTGICDSSRILPEIPCEFHDIKMNYLITDKQLYEI